MLNFDGVCQKSYVRAYEFQRRGCFMSATVEAIAETLGLSKEELS